MEYSNPHSGTDEEAKTPRDETTIQQSKTPQKIIAKKNYVPSNKKLLWRLRLRRFCLQRISKHHVRGAFVSDPEVPARKKPCAFQKATQPERIGSREMKEISVVAKSSVARDFFASFFGLSKKEESGNVPH
jgi:hypothetical protein